MIEQKKIPSSIASAQGLRNTDRKLVYDLYALYEDKLERNLLRDSYYDMKQKPMDLGISVPPNLRNLEQVMGWCSKAVDSLANRSIFDGYVCDDDVTLSQLQMITRRTSLKRKYRKAVKSELKHSCAFLAVTQDKDEHALINAYPATAASALWDSRLERITAGMVVVDRDNTARKRGMPTWINVFTEDAVIEIGLIDNRWYAAYKEHGMGRCLMELFAYNPTLERPFGTSRITRAVMSITDSAMRASVRSEISAEFFTSPQKYLLGADKEVLGDQTKWDAYIGNLFCVSRDENDNVPQFGQLSQGTMQPHLDYIRSLAAKFSGETNVPISELGVIHDNPASAEAIYAAKEPLVIDAQNVNADNGEALVNIALMALAVENKSDFATVRNNHMDIFSKFKDPALPSSITQGDNILKQVQAFPVLQNSEVALEIAGFNDEQMQRIEKDMRRQEAKEIATARLAGSKAGANDNNANA